MIHWFSPNRQEASARGDTRTPWPQSGPKWTRRAPVWGELDRRSKSGMHVLNKVLLELSMEEREELRCKPK